MGRIFMLSLKNFIRKKTNIFNAILIGLIMGLTILISTYRSTMNNFVNNDIKNDFYYNTILVGKSDNDGDLKYSQEEIRAELNSIDNVVGVFAVTSRYNGLVSKQFAINNLSGRTELYAANNKSLPEIVEGSNFPDEYNNYIICPQNFYPNDFEYDNLTRDKFLKISDFLNKDIEFEYSNFKTNEKRTIKYKLIGIYKNNPTSIDENVCFVNEESLLEVYKFEREGQKNFDIEDQKAFYVQINNAKNLDSVYDTLKNKGYMVNPTSFIDYSIFDNMLKKNIQISFILYIIIFVVVLLILRKNYDGNKKMYVILNYIGYQKNNIKKLELCHNIIFFVVSSILTIIMSKIIGYMLQILVYYKPLIFEKKMLIIDNSSLLYLLFIFFIITITASIINCFKISKHYD